MRKKHKQITISEVAATIEKNQWVTGVRSWELHDPDLNDFYFNKREYKLKHRPSKTGLNRNRKPRVEIC